MIEYGEVLKKSYRIFIKYKFLWLFGFLGALSGAGGNFNSFGRFPGSSGKIFRKSAVKHFGRVPHIDLALIIALIFFFLIFIIILLILRVISTGALIGSVNDIDKNEESSIKKGFTHGFTHFFSLLGIYLLIFIPVFFVIVILLAILIGPGIIALFLKKTIVGIILLVFGGLLSVVLIVAIVIFSNIIKIISYRFKIINEKDIVTSIKSAIGLFKEKIGTLFVTWLITVAISIVAGIVIAIPIVVLFVLVIALFFISLIAAVLIAIPAVIIIAFLSGLLETYISIFWTLAFLELVKSE